MKTLVMRQIKHTLLFLALISFIVPLSSVNNLGASQAFAQSDEFDEAPINDDPYNEDPVLPGDQAQNPPPSDNESGKPGSGDPSQPPQDTPPPSNDDDVVSQPPANDDGTVTEPTPPATGDDGEIAQPHPPTENDTTTPPIPPQDPQKYQCDLLIDKTGIYMNWFGKGYVAVTNVTECDFFKANRIPGRCDPSQFVTVLRSEQVKSTDDLSVPRDSLITVIEDKDPSLFLCFSWKHGVILSVAHTKIILVNPGRSKSTSLFEF